MRDYGKVFSSFWTDCFGNHWPFIQSSSRLKFKYPLHAALRKHVFHRDAYKCKYCGVQAEKIPENWDGKKTLFTTSNLTSGYKDMLVVDHILTLKAGGKNIETNMQTLCETCNRKKIKVDVKNIAIYRNELANGAC